MWTPESVLRTGLGTRSDSGTDRDRLLTLSDLVFSTRGIITPTLGAFSKEVHTHTFTTLEPSAPSCANSSFCSSGNGLEENWQIVNMTEVVPWRPPGIPHNSVDVAVSFETIPLEGFSR
ncbi:hypothetical protein B0H11DRAFT_1912572 [Mycena galericulata]|nr:hypothetical protein B0H11DRAFT_1912572 [Mycena galericulata]